VAKEPKKGTPIKRTVTEAKDFLKFNNGIVSLESGTLCANVRRSIAAKGFDQTTSDRLSNAIITKVNIVVTFLSQCRRWMHWVIELFISDLRTQRADLDSLMNPKQNNKIVYWIGNCLTRNRFLINAAAIPPLATRIVLQAYDALGTNDAILPQMPTGITHIYNDMVGFVVTEYTRFFTQGDARLRDKVTFVQANFSIRVPQVATTNNTLFLCDRWKWIQTSCVVQTPSPAFWR
jgi:hypothetical protein